jgi:hypothetical protein
MPGTRFTILWRTLLLSLCVLFTFGCAPQPAKSASRSLASRVAPGRPCALDAPPAAGNNGMVVSDALLATDVAIREVNKFDLRRIESSGLPGGRLADEEAVTDVLRNGLYQERRDAVRDPDPHAVVNFSDARMRTITSLTTTPFCLSRKTAIP